MKTRYVYFVKTIGREWLTLLRQPTLLMTLLGIVAVYPIVISALYERDTAVERPTVVVDADDSALSRALVRNLDATQGAEVIERIDSIEAGWERVRARNAELMVVVPDGFAKQIQRGEQSHVSAWVDGANMLTYAIAWPALFEVVSEMNAELGHEFFYGQGMSSELASRRTAPLSFDARPVYHPSASYGDFLVTGVMLIVLQQMVLVGLAVSAGITRERGGGPDIRYPFTWLEGKAFGQLLLYLGGSALVVYGIFPAFGWSVVDSGAAMLIFGALVVATLPLGLLAAHFTKDRYAAFQTLMFVSTPLYLVSGFTWPLEHMPAAVQGFAGLFPVTPALLALRVASMKSGDLGAVAPYLLWMLGLFVAYTLLALVVVRLTTHRARKAAAAA